MGQIVLVTGGARSGKSVIAESRALDLAAEAGGRAGAEAGAVYIATAQAFDAEMAARIARHRDRRDGHWRTVEAPLDLAEALAESDGQVRLVDCLTLWLSNQMLGGADWVLAAAGLCAALQAQAAPVVIVTNEVGGGIVPDNALARAFRDAAGLLNQQVAAIADEVILAVCGLPMKVK